MQPCCNMDCPESLFCFIFLLFFPSSFVPNATLIKIWNDSFSATASHCYNYTTCTSALLSAWSLLLQSYSADRHTAASVACNAGHQHQTRDLIILWQLLHPKPVREEQWSPHLHCCMTGSCFLQIMGTVPSKIKPVTNSSSSKSYCSFFIFFTNDHNRYNYFSNVIFYS